VKSAPETAGTGSDAAGQARALLEDGRALTRGLVVNALGNVAKLLTPVLLAFATRSYGAERWGVFVGLQALIMVVARVGTLGLDKALLWWVASRKPEDADGAFLPAVGAASLASVLLAVGIAGFGELALGLWHVDLRGVDNLRIILLGLPLFVVTELHLNACIGLRQMEPQVAVRDVIVPLLQVAVALVLAAAGQLETGLAWSFVIANAVGLVCSVGAQRWFFRGRSKPTRYDLPRGLLTYAAPAGLADLSNSLLLRLDTLVLSALTTPAIVGVWGIVSQFSNAIRQIRRAFDPIVTAVSATIAREHDTPRLVAVITYAARLVSVTQLPVFAFLFAFADLLLPLYGPQFGHGAVPVLILCGFWLFNGAAGLSGVVLGGYGHATIGLLMAWLAILMQTILLFALVPPFGLVGAAIAVGGSISIQNLVQMIVLRNKIGRFVFAPRSLEPLWAALAGALAGVLVGVLLGSVSSWSTRIWAFAAFSAAYGGLVFRDYRRGRFAAPGSAGAA
jgi:O-antigen/teichoic acid export membrane protein